jgi:hypothetical protein
MNYEAWLETKALWEIMRRASRAATHLWKPPEKPTSYWHETGRMLAAPVPDGLF